MRFAPKPLLLWTLFLLALTPLSVRAQSRGIGPNVTIQGDLNRLEELPKDTPGSRSTSRDCSRSLKPIRLRVSILGSPSFRVTFTECEETTTVQREGERQSVNDTVGRPLLLRGTSSHRHTSERGGMDENPVAGTLLVENGGLVLEIAVGGLNRRAPERLTIVRAPLQKELKGSPLRGRAVRVSSHAFNAIGCGASEESNARHAPSTDRPSSLPVRALGQTKTIYLGTDFDLEFMRAARCKTASRCNNLILSLVNQVSVHYKRQLGTNLRVTRQRGPVRFTSGTTDSSDMLSNYARFIASNYLGYLHDGANNGPNLVDGFAGFTGQKMRENVVGIATLGTYCADSSAHSANMVVKHISKSLLPLVVAHELGHNLNAVHTARGIMTPSVSKTGKDRSFSRTSVSEMSTYLNDWYGECRAGTNFTPPPGSGGSPSSLELRVTSTPEFNFSLGYTVENARSKCFVRIRAAESATEVDTGTVVLERTQTTNGSWTTQTDITTPIDTALPSEATIFFKAFYICAGDYVRAQSEVITYTPLYDDSAEGAVTRAQWIADLAQLLGE